MSVSNFVLPVIDPIAISIGPLDIRWYGLMYLVGFAFAFWMANRQCDRSNGVWTREQASDLLFYGFMGVILLTKLVKKRDPPFTDPNSSLPLHTKRQK